MKLSTLIKIIKRIPRNGKVLDAGVGSGRLFIEIKKRRPDIECYGIDIYQRPELPKFVKFRKASVENIHCFDKFDLIFSMHVFEHLQDPLKGVSEIYKKLKKGGIAIIECPRWVTLFTPIGFNFNDNPTHIRPFTRKSMRFLFDNDVSLAGRKFRVIKIENQPSYQLYFRLKSEPEGITRLIRKILAAMGLWNTSVVGIAKKIG